AHGRALKEDAYHGRYLWSIRACHLRDLLFFRLPVKACDYQRPTTCAYSPPAGLSFLYLGASEFNGIFDRLLYDALFCDDISRSIQGACAPTRISLADDRAAHCTCSTGG